MIHKIAWAVMLIVNVALGFVSGVFRQRTKNIKFLTAYLHLHRNDITPEEVRLIETLADKL